MKFPDKKDGPKLPPTPKGGGAAARQKQFQLERGLPAGGPNEDDQTDACDATEQKRDDDEPKKKK